MTWTITFFNEKVERETLDLPAGILANFLRITELIEEFGPNLGEPHTKHLEKGMYEIRAKGKESISRTVYCTIKGQEIVILITVIKKGNKIPANHLKTAYKRMKEVQNDDQ